MELKIYSHLLIIPLHHHAAQTDFTVHKNFKPTKCNRIQQHAWVVLGGAKGQRPSSDAVLREQSQRGQSCCAKLLVFLSFIVVILTFPVAICLCLKDGSVWIRTQTDSRTQTLEHRKAKQASLIFTLSLLIIALLIVAGKVMCVAFPVCLALLAFTGFKCKQISINSVVQRV
ncbi:hypothetical protein HELRODRAFT_178942 [Helobdella robusta]|uniref:Uncharacterized protein n=1 Tax=Helobdella robusta TaxID=6412 RepID=T1FDX7_HELRO|nr:hypothetical protein HELRODRAFT_178942 [Helobdella robusta]ESN95761.1 hypothetical protein HELRODRAFT_178942 [Helobdella robusta]